MNWKNIKVKLLFWYSIIIFVILSVFSGSMIYFFHQQNIQNVDEKLMLVKNYIEREILHSFKTLDIEDEVREFSINNLFISLYKFDKQFYLLKSNATKIDTNSLEILQKKEIKFYTIDYKVDESYRVLRTHINMAKEDLYIEVSTTLNDKVRSQLKTLQYILFILIPMVFLLALLMGYFIIKNALLPVKRVIREVKDISIDELHKRIQNSNSQDEIEELIATFNSMLYKIEASVLKIKQFSNDASHELKTPLTVIKGELELALRKDRGIDEYKSILSSLLEETNQLQELIDNLFFLSQENEFVLQNKFEIVELDEVVFDLIIDYQRLAKQKNIVILCDNIQAINIQGNKTLLKIMIGNIIKNSIKYSYEKSKIEIILKNNVLKIKDYGIGMDKKTQQLIFDRFYRADNVRGRGGFGLGLSIVKKISQIHNFELNVESELGKYSIFSISF